MMMAIYLAPLVMLIGALVYGLSSGKASSLGLVAFGAGLLVTLLALGGRGPLVHF